jgi:hypothetical protein
VKFVSLLVFDHHPFLVRAIEEESAGTILKQLIDIMVREQGVTEPQWMSARH